MPCPVCGVENLPSNRFCGQCGAKLAVASEPAGAPAATAPPPASVPPAPSAQLAERRQLTVMFCDLIGSTALSGRLDPEDLREVMQAYRETCVDAIERFGGYIAKYLGDGVLAYFGYPTAHDDDAVRAVAAGLDIAVAMPELEERVGQPRGAELKCRIGIATGPVVVGEMGEGDRRESMAVVGETPNLAARLQERAPPNGVVIAPLTHQLIEGRYEYRSLGAHELKGFARPIELYQVTARLRRASTTTVLPLTGRSAERARLQAALRRAHAGAGCAVALRGEAGMGKSRLVRTLKNEAFTGRTLRLEAHSAPYYTDTPLHPAIELLSRALGFRRNQSVGERMQRLRTFAQRLGLPPDPDVALLARLLSLPEDDQHRLPPLSPQALKARTLSCVLDMLSRVATRRPFVLIVEDIHWADASTLDFLDLFLAALPKLPILLVLTYRPEFERHWPPGASIEVIELGRLSQGAGTRLIHHVAGGMTFPETVVSTILARSDGVPLFIEEITRTLVESQRNAQSQAETSGVRSGDFEIPATLKDSLMSRLDRIAEAKEIAQIGAAIGRNFTYELLAQVASTTEAGLQTALTQLDQASLIHARGTPPNAIYSFKHALVREIAYESMLRRRRQTLHATIVRALETSFPEIVDAQPELLARHLVLAGENARAIDYYTRAGRRAAGRSANVEAAQHLRRAIELIAEEPDSPDRLRKEAALWSQLAPVILVTKGYGSAESGDAFRRAYELNQRIGDPESRFYSRWGLLAYQFIIGDIAGAIDGGEALERESAAADNDGFRAVAIISQGTLLYAAGRLTEAADRVERGMKLYQSAPERPPIARFGQDVSVLCATYGALTLWMLGKPDAGRAMAERALATARAANHPYTLSVALVTGCARVCLLRGELTDALAAVDEAIDITQENKFPYVLHRARLLRGLLRVRMGEGPEAIAEMPDALAAFRALGAKTTVPVGLAWLAEAQLIAGDHAAAQASLQEGLRVAEAAGETSDLAELHRLMGRIARATPATHDDAERHYRIALDVAEQQRAASWRLRVALDLAALWAERGERAPAFKLVSDALGAIEGGSTTADVHAAQHVLSEIGQPLVSRA